jgi:hypothetical protein
MDIVNKLCRRVNEVQLTVDNFATVIGVQAAMKDGIIDTLDQIFQNKYKWPFLAQESSQLLVPGQMEYDLPTGFLSMDWKSFQLQADATLGIRSKYLRQIEREEWYEYVRDLDTDAIIYAPVPPGPGRNMPTGVFSGHGMKFGIFPNPDRAYTVKYRWFKNPDRPVLFSDPITIPQEYEYVLIQGGLMHMYLFYDNNERSTIAEKRRDDGISDMVNTLLGNNVEHVYAGQVNGVNSY